MTKFFIIITITCVLFSQDVFSQHNIATTKIVKIGLLISDENYKEAQYAAEMAIKKANEKEGVNGLHFQLIVRSLEGPWGVGSKEAVDLIFKEKVWAILGSNDSRNAHLVEQVITKTRVVFLSAWASDPTLSQAFVPWYFSCVPNDNQQANAIIKDIYIKGNDLKIAFIADNSYDSKLAVNSFVKEVKLNGGAEPIQLFYDNSMKDFNNLFNQINKTGINSVILFGQPSIALKIMQQMREIRMNQTVYGTLSIMGENEFVDNKLTNYKSVILITSGNWLGNKGFSFQKEFQNTYHKMPCAVAAYTFDGMNILIEAVKNSGLKREKLKAAMSKTNYKGVTGNIQFDEKGNRKDAAKLIEIQNGIPRYIEK